MSAKPQITDSQYTLQSFKKVTDYLSEGVEYGVAPGMVLLIGQAGQVLLSESAGKRQVKADIKNGQNAMSFDTVFDIGSLTSAVVTTTLIMRLVESGKVKLEDKISRYIQGFGVLGKSKVTVGQLLSHTAGIANWAPLYEDLVKANAGARLGILTSRGAKDFIVNSIVRMPLKAEPGTKQIYSELGFILLGHIVEMLTGMSLDKAASRMIFQPLGMRSSSYIDLSMIKRRGIHPVADMIAPTEECTWRKRTLCGEVHDDNAWAMGGIAGHAGLFSNAVDMHIYSSEMLAAFRGKSDFLQRKTILNFWRSAHESPANNINEIGWHYGWDSVSRENGMESSKLSKEAVGICGFTGCSIWFEPGLDLHIILLSNRIHPFRSNKKIFTFRSELHALIIDSLKSL